MRAASRGAFPAAVLDGNLLAKQGDLGVGLVESSREPALAGEASSGAGEGDAGERDGVQDTGLDVSRPVSGQADLATRSHRAAPAGGGKRSTVAATGGSVPATHGTARLAGPVRFVRH